MSRAHSMTCVLLSVCALCNTAAAGPRATAQQMLEARQKNSALLDDPGANYARIPPYFMQGDPDGCAQLRVRFEAELPAAESDHERAALHFLIAEALANEALYRQLQSRASSPPTSLPPGYQNMVAGHYLDAFRLAAATKEDSTLARHITQAFFRCIPSGVASGTADSDLSKRIVSEFIDVIEKRPDLAIPVARTVSAYKRLGIARRLWSQLPEAAPGNADELEACLKLAVACDCSDKAVIYADAVWQRYGNLPKPGGPLMLQAACVVVRAPGRGSDGWQRLNCIAPTTMDAWLELYRAAPLGNPGLSAAARLAFLDQYLDASTSVTRSQRPFPGYYATVARVLMEEGDPGNALHYLDLALSPPSAKTDSECLALLLAKGDCLVRLDRRREAREAYREAMAPIPGSPSRVASLAKDRLDSLDATDGEE